MGCAQSLLDILITGLSKFDSKTESEDVDELPELNIAMTAGYTLENVSRVIKNEVINPIFGFVIPKMTSSVWGDRYISMIAFASIVEGPNPETIIPIIHDAFSDMMNMINDPIPKVRQTVAFSFYKLSEFMPQLIILEEPFLDQFVDHCLTHIGEHPTISTLLIASLKNLFIQSAKNAQSYRMNKYFSNIFTKLIETMYRDDINKCNELQNVSDAVNDITDSCDSYGLKDELG